MPGKRLVLGGALIAFAIVAAPARAIELPATPQPAACTVAALTVDELTEIVTAGATPAAAVSPVPLPANAAAGIEATVAESVACTNANQPLRALALFTGGYLATRFAGAGADDLGHLIAASTRSPDVAAPADRLALVSITNLTILDDGRVRAIVTTANSQQTFVDELTFANVGGKWLIDADVQVSVPGAATPAAGG